MTLNNKESSKNFKKATDYFQCAKTAYASRSIDEATDFLEKTVSLCPKWFEPKFFFVQVLMDKQDYSRCHKQLDEILAEMPDSQEGLFWKGAVFYQEKKPQQARMFWEKAKDLSRSG